MPGKESVALPVESATRRQFLEAASRLRIDDPMARVQELVIYEMTDGTRTSSLLKGADAYVDGGIFCVRLIEILRQLGVRNLYVNVIHTRHKLRSNYHDIYQGLTKLLGIYGSYATDHGVALRFIGNHEESLDPKGSRALDLQRELRSLETLTSVPRASKLTVFFLMNYSTRWDAYHPTKHALPQANVIVRHTKGYVNGDMWLFDKLDDNTFVYVQNGSSSQNWTDEQLVWLVTLALRSKVANEGTHYSMDYKGDAKVRIRSAREVALEFTRRRLRRNPTKRVVLFSPTGPEVYEF
jgi:hypothetical protein